MGLVSNIRSDIDNLSDLNRANPTDRVIVVDQDDIPYAIQARNLQTGYRALKIVRTIDDFGAISNGRVYPTSDKLYMLDGFVQMGNTSIEIPEGGISIAGLNGGRDVMGFYSEANNYTLFVSPDGGYSGDVVLESLTIDIVGTSSKVFDLDNDENSNAVDITGVNFGTNPTNRLTSLGELSNYRQLLFNNVGFLFIADGLTFNGAWSGLACLSSIAVGFPAATLFKEGTSLTFSGSVRTDINFLSVNSASILMAFQASNITANSALSLDGVRTIADDAMPNIDGSSVKARFSNCRGIRNTYVGGQWSISSATATTISGISTPVKIAGTTAYSDLQHFQSNGSNALEYIGTDTIEVFLSGNLSFSGTNGDVINVYVRQWDDSASGYIDLSETAGSTLNASGRAEGVAMHAIGTLDNNDRIELWVENESGARNVTALVNGYIVLSERAS